MGTEELRRKCPPLARIDAVAVIQNEADIYVDDFILTDPAITGHSWTTYQVVPGAGIGGVLATYDSASGDAWWHHYNDLGTLIATTGADGEKIHAAAPDFFGRQRYAEGTSPSTMGLNSKFFFGQSDLNYSNARWLDLERGRWTSPEPYGFDGPNLYHFAFNNPVNGYDPNGLEAGQPYTTPRAAVTAASGDIYALQAATHYEHASTIYSYDNAEGQKEYSYTQPRTDNKRRRVLPEDAPCGTDRVSATHSHPHGDDFGSEAFSTGDMNYAREKQQPLYLAPPSGTVQEYVPPPPGKELIQWGDETPWKKDLQYAELEVNDLTYSVDPSFTYNYGFEVPHEAIMQGNNGDWRYP